MGKKNATEKNRTVESCAGEEKRVSRHHSSYSCLTRHQILCALKKMWTARIACMDQVPRSNVSTQAHIKRISQEGGGDNMVGFFWVWGRGTRRKGAKKEDGKTPVGTLRQQRLSGLGDLWGARGVSRGAEPPGVSRLPSLRSFRPTK